MIGHKFDKFFADWKLTGASAYMASPDGRFLVYVNGRYVADSGNAKESFIDGATGWTRWQLKCAIIRRHKQLAVSHNKDILVLAGVADKRTMVDHLLQEKR